MPGSFPAKSSRKMAWMSAAAFAASFPFILVTAVSGESRPEALNFSSGVCGVINESSSGEKRITVETGFVMIWAGVALQYFGLKGRNVGYSPRTAPSTPSRSPSPPASLGR